MPCEIWETIEDLSTYPKTLAHQDELKKSNLVIGDLHGNCMKLIYILIRYSIMTLKNRESDYEILLSICSKSPHTVIDHDINQFFEILSAAEFLNDISLTVLGDDLADRVYNDLFMLLVYQALCDHRVPYTIILSNHNEIGLRAIRSGRNIQEIGLTELNPDGTPYYISMQASLDNMWTLIKRRVISLQLVQDLIDLVYKPYVCLIGYHYHQLNDLILYTHAPVGLKQMATVMHAWGVVYDDSSTQNMINSIDALNTKYRASIQTNELSLGPLNPLAEPTIVAVAPLLWQRELPLDFTLTPTGEEFNISLFHGHVGESPDWSGTHVRDDFDGLYNFDTNIGKHVSLTQGMLRIAIISKHPALAYTQNAQLITDEYKLFITQGIEREKKISVKLRCLEDLDEITQLTYDHETPSCKLIEQLGLVIHYLHNKAGTSDLVHYHKIISSLPFLLTIEALAEHLTDPKSALYNALYGEEPISDRDLIAYRDLIEENAHLILSNDKLEMRR